MGRLTFLLTLLLSGCTGLPEGITPVSGFDSDRYLGKWYEIARLDHSFERGLEQITAEYSKRDDGGLKVINRGFSPENSAWSEAVGKAFFVRSASEGYLKVSFFGPFYGSYIVFELDRDYRYAFVSGPDLSYLWLLARTPTVSREVVNSFIEKSKSLGFATDQLIFPKQR
ncbi:lipocalin family protein [Mariprofundus aestuarium]|uniref:lipocalin family protein n=1 Tax=Mariprofundus aestuarium TaxID=1921086 RepID=UPI000C21D0DC